MLLKLGVDITRLKRQMRRPLNDIDRAYIDITGSEAVISSTYEGNHSAASLHYANLAVDFRLPGKNITEVIDRLKPDLGPNYDIVLRSNHIHIEHDPKTTYRR